MNVTRTGTTMSAREHPGLVPTAERIVREARALHAWVLQQRGATEAIANHFTRSHIKRAVKRFGLDSKYVPLTNQYTS